MSDRADDEWLEGYKDGGDREARTPGDNRTHIYRLGFKVRRAEIETGNPLSSPSELRRMAAEAAALDLAGAEPSP